MSRLEPSLVLLAALALLVAVLVVGGASFLLLAHARFAAYHRFKGLRVPYPLGPALAPYLAGELRAMLQVAVWHVWARLGWRKAAAEHDRTPVLLVHGYSQDHTNLFGIGRALAACGRAAVPVFLGLPFSSIDGYCPRLHRAIERALKAADAERFDLVAHSMGGVVARRALAQRPEVAQRLRRVVTLGSPHYGTAGARGPLVLGEDARELKRRSGFLAELPTFRDLSPDAEVITVAARQDYIVYPSDTCHLEGARQITLEGVGHTGLLAHPRALAAVREALCNRGGLGG